MASKALKRGNSSAALVVRREPTAKREPVVRTPPRNVEPAEAEMTVQEMLEPRVEAGRMQEARSSFFSSMIAASSSSASASAQRLGTSIVPQVTAEDRQKFQRVETEKQQGGGRSRGKALFNRMAEREKDGGEEEEEEERLLPVELLPGVDMEEMRMTVMMRRPAELLPGGASSLSASSHPQFPSSGVDLEEIEDEFEALHRQMMDETR
jgi:hypothetical protein